MPAKVLLADLTYPEVAYALTRPNVVVLPVGSTEQHGPHLPVDVDIRIATAMAEAAALSVDDEVTALVAPPLPFGISEHHMAFPGSLTLEPETFIAVVYEVGRSLVRHGFERLVILNGHGGNVGALQIIGSKLRLAGGARHVLCVTEWMLVKDEFAAIRESDVGGAAHACEYETSVYLHLRPEYVDVASAVKEMPSPLVAGTVVDLFTPGPFALAFGTDFTSSGVLGDATLASSAKGCELFEAATTRLTNLLTEVAHLP